MAIWHVLVGPPLRARDASREQISPVEGLSALSLDALTSIAYGPEAILAVLAVAGAGALHLVLPITAAIVALLAILVFAYRQVIDAYPGGGGAYSVSRDNFGERVSLLAAAALVVGGDTLALIPLYAIGVFTGFTLSQSGLVVHWRRIRPPCWRYRASLNGLGAAVTGLATVVFLLTKFTEGAWVVVLAVPALIAVFVGIHHYYDETRRALGLGEIPGKPQGGPAVVVVPVTEVSRLTEYGISQALSISRHVLAVTVVHVGARQEPGRASELQRRWTRWDPGVPCCRGIAKRLPGWAPALMWRPLRRSASNHAGSRIKA